MAKGQSEAVLERPQALLDTGTVAGMSDGQLLARFVARRDELAEIAFAALVRRHGPMVWRVGRQILDDWHTAEDAFQATFLILARRAGSIRRPDLLAHWLYGKGRKDFALYLQSRASSVFQCDINPAAKIGRGIFLDHATGLVVGETAVIEDDVSILHDVTLGGTGKQQEDRHPKIRRGVMIGAGAKILGNIEVGHCARIAAGSVVIKPVPNNVTVAGVPARVVGEAGCPEPSRTMDRMLYGIMLDG